MAAVTKNDIPEESEFFTLFWRMVKDFYIPEESDDYWKAFVERCDDIDQTVHTRLGQKLMTAFADYLEEKWRNASG